MRPEYNVAHELGVTVVPLEVMMWENGKFVPYSDFAISAEVFYEKMRTGERLPQSSGAVIGGFIRAYQDIVCEGRPILSIHITSKMSATYSSAVQASQIVRGERVNPPSIEILDSKFVSVAAWFPVEEAALQAKKGANLNQTRQEAAHVIEKSQLLVTLEDFENLMRGGRGGDVIKAKLAAALQIFPVIGFKDGVIKTFATARSVEKLRKQMLEMVGDAGKLVRLAVMHANAPATAEKIKEALAKIYPGFIRIYEVGPPLAVHAGSGAVGIAFQKA